MECTRCHRDTEGSLVLFPPTAGGVEVVLPGDVADRTALIVDDEIVTGGTMFPAVDLLLKRGAREVYATCTHGDGTMVSLGLIGDGVYVFYMMGVGHDGIVEVPGTARNYSADAASRARAEGNSRDSSRTATGSLSGRSRAITETPTPALARRATWSSAWPWFSLPSVSTTM